MQPRRNIAARAAHWSANHRKTAIWGWLAFVFVVMGLVMGAQVVEQKHISTVDTLLRRVPAGRARPDGRRHAAERGDPLIQSEHRLRD